MTEEEQYQMTPYYKNNEEKRVILGLAISKDNKLYRVYACTEDGQAKIKELLNDGGKIESVLTGNIDRVEQLKKYDGKKTMSADEINNLAEGWYNINSIAFNNERGLVR